MSRLPKINVDKINCVDYCNYNMSQITNLGKGGNSHVGNDLDSQR